MVLKQVELSLDTMRTAMRQAGCGDPHQIFAGGLRYIPPSSANQVDRAAFEELSQYGFTQGRGFTPGFEEVLELLDRPPTEYFAYARTMDEQFGVLVAVRGRFAVTALCQGERVWLKTVSPDNSPVDVKVSRVPQPGPGPQITLKQGETAFAGLKWKSCDKSDASCKVITTVQITAPGESTPVVANFIGATGGNEKVTELALSSAQIGTLQPAAHGVVAW